MKYFLVFFVVSFLFFACGEKKSRVEASPESLKADSLAKIVDSLVRSGAVIEEHHSRVFVLNGDTVWNESDSLHLP